MCLSHLINLYMRHAVSSTTGHGLSLTPLTHLTHFHVARCRSLFIYHRRLTADGRRRRDADGLMGSDGTTTSCASRVDHTNYDTCFKLYAKLREHDRLSKLMDQAQYAQNNTAQPSRATIPLSWRTRRTEARGSMTVLMQARQPALERAFDDVAEQAADHALVHAAADQDAADQAAADQAAAEQAATEQAAIKQAATAQAAAAATQAAARAAQAAAVLQATIAGLQNAGNDSRQCTRVLYWHNIATLSAR